MPIPFLKTHWRNLIVATFAAPEELLAKHLPPGVELDLLDGQAFFSLVGFQFQKTSVFGVPSPVFRDFSEWNLRTYVRRGENRGVHFIREFVSHRLVSWAGRFTFNEPFATAPVTAKVSNGAASLNVEYTVTRGGRTHRLSATGAARTEAPSEIDSHFTDLNWGYNRSRRGELMEFEVRRPAWDVHPLTSFEIDVEWAKLYGPEWAEMAGVEPHSVCLVPGSEVSVSMPKTIAIEAHQPQFA